MLFGDQWLMSRTSIRVNFMVVLVLAWAIVCAWLLAQFWANVGASYPDPDDAMRLAEVRAFLAGQGWFDLREVRIDPPQGYLTHWSRLIDAGLAGLYLLFRMIADSPLAERLMQATWPLLWLLPAMGGAAAIAWRCAGRDAAVIAVVLAIFGLPAFQHFQPGRIDHHNVQIALAILTVATGVWSDRKYLAAMAAGALSALALAIGLESLPWIVLTGGAIMAGFIFGSGERGALQRYGLSLSAGTAIAFFVSVPPAQWLHATCDAIGVNTALPAIVGGLAFAVVGKMFADASQTARAVAAGCCALIAAALFIAVEPRCLGGPFAMMDAEVGPLWLTQVREMQSLVRFFGQAPLLGVWVSAFPAAALCSALVLACGRHARRDFGYLTAVGAFVLAVVATVAVVKAYSYAMWFGMPLVAAAVLQIAPRTRAARWLAAAALTPAFVSGGAIAFANAAIAPNIIASASRQACFRSESYLPLAGLPAGLVVADVDFGPLIIALTPHSAMAAPYHRISAGIIAAHRVFASPPAEARKILTDSSADYLVICGGERVTGLDRATDSSLWYRLRIGDVPPWLEAVDGPADRALIVFRIRR